MILNIVAYQKKPFSATVVVTCPSGTTSCTLTKSGSTATQTAHSGNTYTFSVNGDAAKGTWTATASNGSKTTSSTVNVQTDGGSHSVTLPAYPVDPDPPTPTYATLIVNWAVGQFCTLTDPDGNTVFEFDTSGYWTGTPTMTGLYTAVCSNADPTIRTVNVTSTSSGTYIISW